jgi:putative aminopeptidase FrvX
MKYTIDKEFLLSNLKDLLTTPSPSGYCQNIMEKIESKVSDLGFRLDYTKKGCGFIRVKGENPNYTVGLSAHLDTLGGMVRSIKSTGMIRFTNIGGNLLPTLDGEYCTIHTRNGKEYTGTILSTSPAVHVYKDAKDKERNEENLEIRIDESVKSKEDVEKLGIKVGDFISIDPKTTITDREFIKSRHIDDKGGTACLLTLLKSIKDGNLTPKNNLMIFISTFEEVGHGSSYIPEEIDEMIAVDMGCIGDDLTCTEKDVSICVKDSSGPYDYDMTNRLIKLAEDKNLNHAVDIYPYYSSDASAALRAGNNIKCALIGPGVHASHGMERTHYDALENTLKLLLSYISE